MTLFFFYQIFYYTERQGKFWRLIFLNHLIRKFSILFHFLIMTYSTMKVKELKAALDERGLDSAGKKAELIARLEQADGAENVSFKSCQTILLVFRHFLKC